MGIGGSFDDFMSARGLSKWEGKPITTTRLICVGPTSVFIVIAAKDSGIKSIKDLKGKVWHARYPGSLSNDTAIRAILAAAGLEEEKDVKVTNRTTKTIPPALREGRADAAISALSAASPIMHELAQTGDGYLVGLTPEEMKVAMTAEPSMISGTLKAGTFKGQDEDETSVAIMHTMNVASTMPDNLVYAVTAALHDNFLEFLEYSAAFSVYNVKKATLAPEKLVVPVHAGAVMYYKERGFWKEAHEKKQQALLKEIGVTK